ncbi:MAG: hypothetical protein IJ074_12775 [Clostridia bacterium]|nr:hypothetical protein [Clostridia bacterium]
MGIKNIKKKGCAGERELAVDLTARGYPAHRNDQRYSGSRGNPDIDAIGCNCGKRKK